MLSRKLIKSIGCFILVGLLISCGVSSGEVIKAKQEDNNVEASNLPVLQICPIEEKSPFEEIPSVTNFFVEPIKNEEANNNIIVIETNEPEISVVLNSTFLGLSKITITDLLPGQYILDLSKDGFESQRNYINVEKNRKSYFYFEMKRINNDGSLD